jgi:hypothetical protein
MFVNNGRFLKVAAGVERWEVGYKPASGAVPASLEWRNRVAIKLQYE